MTPVLLNDAQVFFVFFALVLSIIVCVMLTYQMVAPAKRVTMYDRWYDHQTSARTLTALAQMPQGPIYDARCGRYRDPVTKRFCKAPQFA